jgi:catechol 2,3-dioxygenase-like lactoylglutathione lyase family enzyme
MTRRPLRGGRRCPGGYRPVVPEIASLSVADPPELWSELGFVVADGASWVSGIRHALGGSGTGVVDWLLRDADGFDELPLGEGPTPLRQPTPEHPNSVRSLDHVVIATPDLARTIAAFENHGIRLRRTRDTGTEEHPSRQAFFRLGETIAEVVGSPERSRPGRARFYGLAFTVDDLSETARFLGRRLRPAQDAVQLGRQIATLDRAAGSSVPIAFMSPER